MTLSQHIEGIVDKPKRNVNLMIEFMHLSSKVIHSKNSETRENDQPFHKIFKKVHNHLTTTHTPQHFFSHHFN
jgi:hypothetical protein